MTVAGHNPHAFSNGVPQPTVAGVFNNRIVCNTVSDNGVAGQGAGVPPLATPLPGGAVYDNQAMGTVIWGNGLAVVTVHSHAPGQALDGNTSEENLIADNVYGVWMMPAVSATGTASNLCFKATTPVSVAP